MLGNEPNPVLRAFITIGATPIDQAVVIKAISMDTKLKDTLYNTLGMDLTKLKKTIASEITRGIASGMQYSEIQRNLSNATGMPLSRARLITRTEAGRVQEAATMDAAYKAMEKGADVVKQWCAVLDSKTRYHHMLLDKQTRELKEPFTIGGKKAMQPHDFGDPAEDCNCRCTVLIRARAALDADELKAMQERASYYGLSVKDSKAFGDAKAKDFSDFKKKYLKAAEKEEETTFWNLKGGKPEMDYKIALTNRFEEGNDTAKAVYSKYVPEGGAVAGSAPAGKAYTKGDKVYMDFADDAANVRGAGTTYFHEHGHYVDYKAGDVSHSAAYLDALKRDVKALYESTGERKKRDAEYAIMRMLTKPEIRNKVNGISDMVCGLTNGKTGGGWTHDITYYKGYALQQEAFAHMFEASFSTEKQALMKQYFPDAWEVFMKLMEGLR